MDILLSLSCNVFLLSIFEPGVKGNSKVMQPFKVIKCSFNTWNILQ